MRREKGLRRGKKGRLCVFRFRYWVLIHLFSLSESPSSYKLLFTEHLLCAMRLSKYCACDNDISSP